MTIRSLLILILVVSPVAFSADDSKQAAEVRVQSDQELTTIKVLLWNLWHGGNDVDKGPEKILELIRKTGADICLLQESYDINGDRPKAGAWLAKELKWNQYQGKSTHLCVLTHFPIKEEYFHATWHGVGAWLDLGGGRELIAYSTWIDYRNYLSNYLRSHPEATDEQLLECETKLSKRLAQAKAFLEHLKTQGHLDSTIPVLVGGDWNCPSHLDWTEATAKAMLFRRSLALPVSRAMKDAGFADTFRVLHPDPIKVPGNTWSPLFRQDEEGNALPMDRIDRLYLKNPAKGITLTPLSATVLPEQLEDNAIPVKQRRFPSDHAAVLIELEISTR